jgi:hypothetical protein
VTLGNIILKYLQDTARIGINELGPATMGIRTKYLAESLVSL